MTLTIIFLIAVAVLAWVLAGRAERRHRQREADAYGDIFGPVCGVREQLLKDPTYGEWFG